MSNKKIVLVSHSGYASRHDEILRRLIEQKVELFCAVGKDCERWEEVMDELCVGPTGNGQHIITTASHPNESLEEVIAFAKRWQSSSETGVEVIEVE